MPLYWIYGDFIASAVARETDSFAFAPNEIDRLGRVHSEAHPTQPHATRPLIGCRCRHSMTLANRQALLVCVCGLFLRLLRSFYLERHRTLTRKIWAPDLLQVSSFDDLCQSAGASCVCATSAVAVLHFYLENTMISNSNDRLVDGPRVDL